MSYCIQGNAIVSVQRNMTHPVHIADTDARANSAGLRPRGRARAEDTEPSLITAIADELAKISGGPITHHMAGARRILEEAFRAVGQVNGVTALCEKSPHAG